MYERKNDVYYQYNIYIKYYLYKGQGQLALKETAKQGSSLKQCKSQNDFILGLEEHKVCGLHTVSVFVSLKKHTGEHSSRGRNDPK